MKKQILKEAIEEKHCLERVTVRFLNINYGNQKTLPSASMGFYTWGKSLLKIKANQGFFKQKHRGVVKAITYYMKKSSSGWRGTILIEERTAARN